MTQFAYTAVPLQGGQARPVSGRLEAADERAVRDDLRRKGLIAVRVRPVRTIDSLRSLFSRESIRASESAWFFQMLRTLLGSAVPIEAALATMHDLSPTPRLRRACAVVRERLRSGASPAEAVSAVPGLALPRFVALLRSGHESGRLAHVVALIDTSIASSARLRRIIVGRLIYPAILFAAAVGAVWFLSTFVIPRFAQTLEALGGVLPLSTRITLGAGRLMVWALPAAAAAGAAAYAWRGTILPSWVRRRAAEWVLRLPVVGALVHHHQATVIADVLATMIEGGADVLAGLEQGRSAVSSPVLADRLREARDRVREGTDPGEALDKAKVLPPVASAILRAGIKGGDLPGGLRRAAAACLERQEKTTERLLVLLEPGVILFLAATVGWVVYSLVMGMLALSDLRGL